MQDPENSGNSNHKSRMQRKSQEEDREVLGMTKTKMQVLRWFAILFLKIKFEAYQ